MPYNKKENQKPVDTLHIFVCIRRRKDNGRIGTEPMFRQIIRDEALDLEYCRQRIRSYGPGIWRIYKTVNARSVKKAFKVFFNRLVDEMFEGPKNIHRIDSLWKTCLLQPECRAEKNFLIDCDTDEAYENLRDFGIENNSKCKAEELILPLETIKTPNGYHVITNPFNKRIVKIPDVEVNSDGFKFIELIEVK